MAKGEAKKIIVGLGNPGKEYEHTYHNAGALFVKHGLRTVNHDVSELKKHKGLFEYAETDDAVLVLPLTFMNESGKAVREALKKFNAKPESLIVLHDDSDITIGDHKISFARGSAGHKGVQSIIDALKTNAFTRARIGIRPQKEMRGEARRKKAGEFALKNITLKDQKILSEVFTALNSYLIAHS